MKNNILCFAAFTAIILCSCSNENELSAGFPGSDELVSLNVVLGGSAADIRPSTRASVDIRPAYSLEQGDEIGMFNKKAFIDGKTTEADNLRLLLSNDLGNFTFEKNFQWQSGTSNNFYVYYPYHAESTMDETSYYIDGTLDSKQELGASQCYNMLYRQYKGFQTSRKGTLYIENLQPFFPTVRMSIASADDRYATGWSIKSAKLVSEKPLKTGKYEIDLEAGSVYWFTAENEAEEVNEYTVAPQEGTTLPISLNVPAEMLLTLPLTEPAANMTLTVTITDGTEEKEVTLKEPLSLALKQGMVYSYSLVVGSGEGGDDVQISIQDFTSSNEGFTNEPSTNEGFTKE